MELLGWLTAAVFAPPGEALRKDLESGALEEAFGELLGRPYPLPHPALEELQAAHTALFVTNPEGLPAPPYAGLARDGALFGPSLHELLELYEKEGLEVQGIRDLPDHLSVLGEAIALLAEEKPRVAQRLAQGFLLPWLRTYGERVRDHDPTGFYARCVEALRLYLEEVSHEAKDVS